MTTKIEGGLVGVDHVAYVTWNLEETVHFYRDVLGFPFAHCILAPGWGNNGHPDFAHLFFDLGAGARLAFFYYFGVPDYQDPNLTELLRKGRHLALLVDTEEELDDYERRLEAVGHDHYRYKHELIESLYMTDPNGYHIEITRKLRPLLEADTQDAELTLEALIEISRDPEPSIEKVWDRKADLIMQQGWS
jgi:catechol 2,3-dioxygenase-like lactoylglutathione lyase family enzyme